MHIQCLLDSYLPKKMAICTVAQMINDGGLDLSRDSQKYIFQFVYIGSFLSIVSNCTYFTGCHSEGREYQDLGEGRIIKIAQKILFYLIYLHGYNFYFTFYSIAIVTICFFTVCSTHVQSGHFLNKFTCVEPAIIREVIQDIGCFYKNKTFSSLKMFTGDINTHVFLP